MYQRRLNIIEIELCDGFDLKTYECWLKRRRVGSGVVDELQHCIEAASSLKSDGRVLSCDDNFAHTVNAECLKMR